MSYCVWNIINKSLITTTTFLFNMNLRLSLYMDNHVCVITIPTPLKASVCCSLNLFIHKWMVVAFIFAFLIIWANSFFIYLFIF